MRFASASWGPTDNGETMEGPGKLAAEAFALGIREVSLFIIRGITKNKNKTAMY